MCIKKRCIESNELSKMWSTFFLSLKMAKKLNTVNSFDKFLINWKNIGRLHFGNPETGCFQG